MTEENSKKFQPRIFISYRHADKKTFVLSVHRILKDVFGKDNIFLDAFAIRAGFDFRDEIKRGVENVDVMLVMVGSEWQKLLDAKKDQEADYVRIEIQSALELDKIVIPVTMNNAPMPLKGDLPDSIKEFVYREKVDIDENKDFEHDVDVLIEAIKESFKERLICKVSANRQFCE